MSCCPCLRDAELCPSNGNCSTLDSLECRSCSKSTSFHPKIRGFGHKHSSGRGVKVRPSLLAQPTPKFYKT